MTKKLLWMLIPILLLVSCGPNPEKEAKSSAIRRESEAQYLATATAVAIREEYASVAIAATATAIADKEAVRAETQPERITRQENLIWWSTIAGIMSILALGAAISIASVGGASAFSYQARQRARLVWIDKTTRTWPVMLDTKTGLLVDLETGERARLDSVNQVDHRRLIISGQARVTGLLTQSAEKIAKSKNTQIGDMLPAIGKSVPLLDADRLENG